MGNPLFSPSVSPSNTTKPTKAVNNAGVGVRLSHNTFDNSFFLFKTQRYGFYEPFWWKNCVAGDNEPYSNSHNVRSLPFASPVLSPMKLNKDYFQVPMYAIQPNTWDYIFKNPTQGDDVPYDSQNLFPIHGQISNENVPFTNLVISTVVAFVNQIPVNSGDEVDASGFLAFMSMENFISSGSLMYNMGFKFNPVFLSDGVRYSYDEIFDIVINHLNFNEVTIDIDDPDSPTGSRSVTFTTLSNQLQSFVKVDHFTILSLIRSFMGSISSLTITRNELSSGMVTNLEMEFIYNIASDSILPGPGFAPQFDSIDCIRMDVINAYQLACAQYYVNPRVDFIYNAQLYRDNFIQELRQLIFNYYGSDSNLSNLTIANFDYNGIPVLYDYFSYKYYAQFVNIMYDVFINHLSASLFQDVAKIIYYLFGYREQLRFGNYITDSRTQALGYGEPGSDVVQVFDNGVSITDMSQKLVLERFRGAVAHLDGSAEDYLATMFHEQLPPDYHYPKFIAHSEFGISGDEISNTTSDDQGNIVTNLKSGQDSAEFNIEIALPSILIGISYISIPELYCQIKERHYFHGDRYDMFQSMLQYFGDQEIYNREVSDTIENPADSYAYVSRNGEYKQRLSQVAGGFLTKLRSWVFTVDLPSFAKESYMPRLANTQSPVAIRAHDFEFNRFLARRTGYSLGTGFHFIMQYDNKNVANRPMDVNPLPLYPSNSL